MSAAGEITPIADVSCHVNSVYSTGRNLEPPTVSYKMKLPAITGLTLTNALDLKVYMAAVISGSGSSKLFYSQTTSFKK